MSGARLAITGATGFVGQTLMRIALDHGASVQALTRRPQPARAGVTWITGALDDPASLAALTHARDAVIHVAGVVSAATRAGFAAGNIAGTQAVVDAATAAGVRRFIHVSSLSAREPALSDYGWSKAEAEAVVRASGLDWTIIRPPAIYGPGDREMVDLYKMARRGIVLMPPAGRVSLIHVGDLARLLLALVDQPATFGGTYEADDGHAGGWHYSDYGRMIGDAVGRRVVALHMPGMVVKALARLDRTVRGEGAKLTPDRAAYLCHPDWVISPGARVPPAIWQPQIDTASGLRETATAYRAAGWL